MENNTICNNFVITFNDFYIMELSVIAIGNSKGIRLSKTILEKYNIKDKVELILENEHIIIKPLPSARTGWDDAFKKMHERGDDKLLIDDLLEDEDLEAWK